MKSNKMCLTTIAILSFFSAIASNDHKPQTVIDSTRADAEKGLSEAEHSCSPLQYHAALLRYKAASDAKRHSWALNRSLDTVACRCATSRNLKGMIQTNLALGGQATDTSRFDSCQREAPFFCGYNRTALGLLARGMGSITLAADVQKDVNDAVRLLLEQDPANKEAALHSALLDSASVTNLPVATALLANGANPYKQLPYERNPLTVSSNPNAIESHSAMQAAQSTLRNHRNYRNEWGWAALKTTVSFPFRYGLLKAKIAMANTQKSKKDNEEELFRVTKRPEFEWNQFNMHRARLRDAKLFLSFLKRHKPVANSN